MGCCFSSRRRHTRWPRDWSSDVCSSDLRTETASGTTRDLYYSAAWQVLEERVSGSWTAQYVWSPVYVDALIQIGRASCRERGWVAVGAGCGKRKSQQSARRRDLILRLSR